MEKLQGTTAPSNSNWGFQVGWCMLAECSASLLLTEEARPLSLVVFCYLCSFWGTTSPSSAISFSLLFFFKLGMRSKPIIVGGRKGRASRGWDLEVLYSSPWRAPLGLFSVQGHFLFVLRVVVYASNDKTKGANTWKSVELVFWVRDLNHRFS